MNKENQPVKKLDGANFWAPQEGLKVAADLLKLAESYFADGASVRFRCNKARAIESLQKVQAELRFLFNKVRPFVEASFEKRRPTDNPTFSTIEMKAVEKALAILTELRRVTVGSDAAIKLRSFAIDYPGHAIEFDSERYFDFANNSLKEVLYLIRNGKLIGMKPGQFAQPIYGEFATFVAQRAA